MDITSSNFIEKLPEIENTIDSADFIAIDTEFTGLRNGQEITAYDTPSEYYNKLREGSLNFLLVQIGICCFKFNEFKNKYNYKAFNFYIFPRPINGCNNDVNFLCQASSIHFLINNRFDFNKLFKEGISYLTMAQEKNLLDELETKYKTYKSDVFTKVNIPPELISAVENACDRIKNFLSPDNKEEEIVFDKCNGFMRKLIFQTAYERFSSENFCLNTKWIDRHPVLVAQKGKSKADQNKENYEKELNEIKNSVGFTKVIQHISNSKKLIVGHNMLLDICHIINRFYWPLPENYWEFKQMVHELFPRLIDTKYMCNSHPFKEFIPSSIMPHMIEKLKNYPFNFPEANAETTEFEYSVNSEKEHEAGYDALMTGLSFIALTTYLANRNKNDKDVIKVPLDALKTYENRLFIMKVIDYSYVNLKGEEPKPSRKHVFHLTFPKEWKTSDIIQLFNPYGDIHVSYCNQVSAWITLLNENKYEKVKTELIDSNSNEIPGLRKPYTILTYNSYYEKNSVDKHRVKNTLLSLSRLNEKHNKNNCNDTSMNNFSNIKMKIGNEKRKLSEENIPSNKRKKNEPTETEHTVSQESNEDNSHLCKSAVCPETKCKSSWFDKLLKMKKRLPTKMNNLLFDLSKGKEDNLRRTFEESSSWE